jgi:hypothetical protein
MAGIVEVRPIEREKWHKKIGKDSFKRPVTVEALVSIHTGQYSTGLSKEDRTRLEEATGFNLSPDYVQGKAHEFWNSTAAQIKLEHKTNIFKVDRPLDEIKVKVLKASDLVANSQKEWEEGKFPHALFVIFDEEEDMELRASKGALKRKVIIESSKLTASRKAEIVQILSGVSVRKQTPEWIDLKLDEEIEQKGAERVLVVMERDKKRTSLHAMALEALQKNVLRKEGSAIYYMDDQIGFDLEATLDYFADKKNQPLKAQILEKIND